MFPIVVLSLSSLALFLGYLLFRKDRSIKELLTEKTDLTVKCAELSTRLSQAAERENDLEKVKESFSDAFKALSSEALEKNNQRFLQVANLQFEKLQAMAENDLGKKQDQISEMVKPVRESLERVDLKIQEFEKTRARSDEMLLQNVKSLVDTQKELKLETSNLVTALRSPQGRGRWGEMQLKRVVEMAGMLEHCDFVKQESASSDEGRLRPDLIVKLPGGKNIVVDAKAPLLAYLDAIQQTNIDAKKEKLTDHSRQVRKHLDLLSRKAYWDQFQPAPEFVVLFLPGEAFFSAALESDPHLIEAGVAQNVIIATPTTLIALLRSVHYGWRQEKLAQNAKVIGELGKDLYKRISDMAQHIQRVGRGLEAATDSYNKAIGSLETRVLVSARRFKDLESSTLGTEIEILTPIEQSPRKLASPEMNSPES